MHRTYSESPVSAASTVMSHYRPQVCITLIRLDYLPSLHAASYLVVRSSLTIAHTKKIGSILTAAVIFQAIY